MISGKAILKEILSRCVMMFGIDHMVRALLWRDRVAILLYHDPDPATLDRHLTYLRTICDLVPLDARGLPGNGRPRAAITLDDGLAGNARLLPIFIKHKVRPTIFLCSRIVCRPRRHWWLHPAAERLGVERLKRLANDQRLAELRVHGYDQDGDDEPTGLSMQQLEAMRPYVDFQAHTRFHPILTRCGDSECKEEIVESRHEVEALTGNRCEHFAYPNGNYGKREINLLKAAGYKSARTCDVGWNDHRSDAFRLKTIIIDDHASLRWFICNLTGIPLFLGYLRKGGGLRGHFPQF
ncbi:polysaccharide deacetylase family protein [Burkholderia sp. Tr-862]|uniref:polysaccharide deacetylase family protein n=1 Tax=Burkholderia sp. Tr-862 TaxID=2608331 RepID=UPI001419C4CB|nr:polysaccharide deacetylase family protein [Burkholderia sp. Tr-862]NIF41893.1 polysaccharide deacetylase family protein [Burkholderia sp. Tr-862]